MGRLTPLRWLQIGVLVLLVGTALGYEILPDNMHATSETFQHPQTGILISNDYGFLSYWRELDGERLLGAPVTAVLDEQGMPVQYFERGRLEAHIHEPGSPIMLGRIGAEYAERLWVQFADGAANGPNTGRIYVEATRQTLGEPFLSFWHEMGGMHTLGYPISEPIWEHAGTTMVEVQYFERGRLERHPAARGTPDVMRVSNMGTALAALRGYTTSTPAPTTARKLNSPAPLAAAPEPTVEPVYVAPEPEPVYVAPEPEPVYVAPEPEPVYVAPEPEPVYVAPEPEPVYVAPEPEPVYVAPEPVYVPGPKNVVVNLSHQWLYAYEGNVLVFSAPVSTGRDGFNTPTGFFSIYAKNPLQTMSGTLQGEYYNVPDVPNAMYIVGSVAMHGTYWHNMFGTGVRMSHGCINLPLDSAAWLYNWAPIGTPVQVTY